MATRSGSGPVAGEPSAPVPAGFWNCMAVMPAKEHRQTKMTSFLAPLSEMHVANSRQRSAIVTCITPRMEAVCVTMRKSSAGSFAFRGMKSVVHEKPISVRLPSSLKMWGSPNRQKAKALKYSTRS